MDKTFIIKKPADFSQVTKFILDWHKENNSNNSLVLALSGDLGAGKTAFTQILGKEIDVSEHITSPTFTVMKQYGVPTELFESLIHIDAYRIEEESELGPLKIKEILARKKTCVCIEWPEKISSVIPDTALKIDIEISDGEDRKVHVYSKK